MLIWYSSFVMLSYFSLVPKQPFGLNQCKLGLIKFGIGKVRISTSSFMSEYDSTVDIGTIAIGERIRCIIERYYMYLLISAYI